jgi:hypothetical protein
MKVREWREGYRKKGRKKKQQKEIDEERKVVRKTENKDRARKSEGDEEMREK